MKLWRLFRYGEPMSKRRWVFEMAAILLPLVLLVSWLTVHVPQWFQ